MPHTPQYRPHGGTISFFISIAHLALLLDFTLPQRKVIREVLLLFQSLAEPSDPQENAQRHGRNEKVEGPGIYLAEPVKVERPSYAEVARCDYPLVVRVPHPLLQPSQGRPSEIVWDDSQEGSVRFHLCTSKTFKRDYITRGQTTHVDCYVCPGELWVISLFLK